MHGSVIKKYGFALGVLFLLLASGTAVQGATAGEEELTEANPGLPGTYNRRTRTTLWSSDHYGQFYISGGLSEQFQYISFLGFRGAIDYQLNQRFSIGGQAALYYGNSQFYKQRTPLIGPRVDYHFVRPRYFRRGQELDMYLGISGDVYFGAGKVKSSSETLSVKPDAHLGLRYRVGKHLFLGSEFAYRYVYIGMTVEIP